ncbi:phosphopantetheine-binding protein, partial [Duganella sp. Root1480D1]|uniref:phosphopantetheine-binding protein n=1 Tax=Duganella sp. Root1480D1 TaxID=1736471 RepID=UPI0035A720C2
MTAERFIANPFGAGRLYKTGDLGRWREDGSIEYLGRNDFQVKLRGFRIELGEIEAALAACAGVREALVLAREDVPGEVRLVAYLLPQEGVQLEAATLRQQVAEALADYMVPSAFVTLATFPLNANGKVDRKALPAPEQEDLARQRYEAPCGEVEQQVAQIWQDLLGVEQVGRHDDFFELGGHSLLAVQLMSRLRQQFEVEVDLGDLFADASLEAFAATVARARASAMTAIVPADRSQPLPLSWAQQRLWFLEQLDPAAGAAYRYWIGLRLHGQLDTAALQA